MRIVLFTGDESKSKLEVAIGYELYAFLISKVIDSFIIADSPIAPI